MDERVRPNHRLWQDWAQRNFDSEFYDVPGFKRGGVRIPELEQRELGDVTGQSLLHLQCHFGLDTLSWARLGARATGIDFSERAIELARGLAKDCELDARFVCCDVYATPKRIDEKFDVVYTSHGVLGWLPDLGEWARVIAHHLEPGGRFYLMEMHPLMWMIQDRPQGRELELAFRYFAEPEPVRFEYKGCYTDPEGEHVSVEHAWSHPISEVIGSLLEAGLQLEFLHEFPFMKWKNLPFMEEDEQGWWVLPADVVQVPCMFSLLARKPR